MQHRMSGAVGGSASALRDAFTEFCGHAAERTLIDFALGSAAEWYAVMFKLDNGGDRLAAHIFDRILIAEPVGALDRVVHVPAPVVFAHIAERGGDAALRCNGMAARWKYFCNAGRAQSFFGHAERRA